MNLGQTRRQASNIVLALAAALLALMASTGAFAQEAQVPAEAPPAGVAAADDAAAADVTAAEEGVEAAGSYTPMAPTEGKGMPTSYEDDPLKSMTFQDQYTVDGDYALWMHDAILLPIITVISLFVLGLLLWVIVKYNRRANPTPSKTTHNTAIEVIWTLVPVAILVVIAVPSISLLAAQYETPPEDAVTIKATGYQWYWGYTYPDNGGFEVISNMMDESEALANGEPPQLAVDNRMVVPANTPLRIQTTGADVIHSFGVASLWFKLDAVPGRLNERMLVIEEPGVYYGQCYELCGARHAYMPVVVEALPRAEWEAWVLSKGGTIGTEDETENTPTALDQPSSALPGAPDAGEPATEDTSPTT